MVASPSKRAIAHPCRCFGKLAVRKIMSSIEIPQTAAIGEYAIIVDPNDNVAVVKKSTFAELEVLLPDGKVVQLRGSIPPGHRFATRKIPAGSFVLQFGQPIGTSLGIEAGEQIT